MRDEITNTKENQRRMKYKVRRDEIEKCGMNNKGRKVKEGQRTCMQNRETR